MPSISNLRNTNSQGKLGNFADIAVKETSVGNDGLISKSLDSRSGSEGRPRLVESNMTIRTNTTQEELNTTDTGNLSFKFLAFFIQIRSISVQDVHVLRLNIDMLEQVVPHE